MTIIKISELKKFLKENDQKELIQLISELYKLNKDVQYFLSNKFLGENASIDLFNITKKKIKDEFFPDRGFGKLRLTDAKNAISNFKKLTNDNLKTLDLMLYYVELGTDFTNSFGDIDGKFYNSMLSMYDKVAIECDKDEKIYHYFKDRLYSIFEESEGIGWGYHDEMADIYYSISYVTEED